MNILVLGSGGREHAICRSLKLSPETERLFCIPGSPGIAQIAECPADVPGSDWAAIADWAAAFDGPKTGMPFARMRSAAPSHRGASGPTTTRSMAFAAA